MTLQRTLAEYIVGLKYEDIGVAAKEKIQYLLLDAVGVAQYVSRHTIWGGIMKEYALRQGHPGKATLVGSDKRVYPTVAAFANGTNMLGCEMEDTLTHAYLHLGPPVFGASLALSEQNSFNGKSFITAVYAAYEVTAPIGALIGRNMLLKGAHPTSHLGCIAATAATSKLLGLSVEQTENALGIAIMMSSGFMQAINEGSMTRRLYGGLPAQTGIVAAEMAQLGFDGPHRSLEGEGGLLQTLFADETINLEAIAAELGNSNQVLRSSFKRHACCHAFHACIDILLDLQQQHAIDTRDIKKIKASIKLISHSHANKRPTNAASAQYSLPYCLAAALHRGQVGPDEFTEASLEDEALFELADLVETDFPDDLQRHEGFPGRLTVFLNDGSSFSDSLAHAKTDIQNEQTYRYVDAKFTSMTKGISNKEREYVRAQCAKLDQLEDLNTILSPN